MAGEGVVIGAAPANPSHRAMGFAACRSADTQRWLSGMHPRHTGPACRAQDVALRGHIGQRIVVKFLLRTPTGKKTPMRCKICSQSFLGCLLFAVAAGPAISFATAKRRPENGGFTPDWTTASRPIATTITVRGNCNG